MTLRPIRLRTRIALYFVALLVSWTFLVMGSINYLLSDTSRRLLREEGNRIVRTLADQSETFVHYEDTLGLAACLERQRKTHSGIRYIAVLGDDGIPIWSTFPQGGLPQGLLAVPYEPPPGQDVSVRLLRSAGELLYGFECRKGGIRVRMGLSLSPIQETVRTLMTSVLWIGAAGFLAVFALALYVSRPVETLTRMIERAVHLDRETGGVEPLPATEETLAIANRFNELVGRLEERDRQLDVSKKLAYLGEISANIAHEVNNPLGVIVMNSDFLLKRCRSGQIDSGAAEEVERLCLASKRATLAVQKLLQFARYSVRGDDPRHRKARIAPLLQETAALLQDRICSSRSRVRIEVPDALPPVSCDEQGIQQVLLNLLTNALDAGPEEGEILVRAAQAPGTLSIQVVDQGPGMDPEVLRRAKEPFFTTKEHGTGLGLAISESIVRAHGEELTLENKPDGGTSVTVQIPVREEA